MEKLLLHSCCAPCSVYCVDTLRSDGIEPVSLWFNPNIHPWTEYDMRRRLIVSGFNKLGLICREPRGAFYAFPSIKTTGMSSEEFCERLLYSKRVAVIPGTAFGNSGEGFVRASYCYSTEHIKEALERISEFFKDELN